MPRDWLGRKSPRWPILCRVGRKTLTQSIRRSSKPVSWLVLNRIFDRCRDTDANKVKWLIVWVLMC